MSIASCPVAFPQQRMGYGKFQSVALWRHAGAGRQQPFVSGAVKMEFAMIQSKKARFCLWATALTIGAGLVLRRYGYALSLPFPIVKYGGSILWGSMVYFIVASASFKFRDRFSIALAFAIAVLVEFFRLYHTPWLDTFRMTTAGALLIGRVFSVWNIAAYACGIIVAFLVKTAANRC